MIEITKEFAVQIIQAFDTQDHTTMRRLINHLENKITNPNNLLCVKKRIKMPDLNTLKKE